ncbi:putative x-pro dipeptidyl-peptidase [Phaeomoniella chlamydospora]|uniref:Putative x-pro dipeptidyl-peptidase n=1 Tax=Phaeomoniella chlamydospora TaxID=158046 RepID=A0A0G2ECL6_PHACM|nr:putative x-pro dipeptidyl-peptidase [Phaeomoniella chlamydospora]
MRHPADRSQPRSLPRRHCRNDGSDVREASSEDEDIKQRINWFREDFREIDRFYNVSFSSTRSTRLQKFYDEHLTGLSEISFDSLSQEGKVDYILLQNYITRQQRQLDAEVDSNKAAEPLLLFSAGLVRLCEERQQMKPMEPKKTAQDLFETTTKVLELKGRVESKEVKISKFSAFRAANKVDELCSLLKEWFSFYNGYDPMFTWWVSEPYKKIDEELQQLAGIIRERLVGIKGDEDDTIVGDPIGRSALMDELEAEKIPYTPEQLIEIGDNEYVWCEEEMKKASRELGYGDDWHRALEYVKDLHVEPGKQTELVHDLAREAVDYVKTKDMVTIPQVAEEAWRMFMMSPEQQEVNPFFLGGTSIIVSYPTDKMNHGSKLMSMRGNNPHFSRSTVFHELIPGHHLQLYMNARVNRHRSIFDTPFCIEGWAFYWEMVLWDDPEFPKGPENRIGMLFWRMHRCARITFSLKFHLGQMTPQACIDYLVDKVGHERFTAEGEVRRSFAGEYSPLYQAAYMMGALQFYALRRELVSSGKMDEKVFHDRILKAGQMPVELLRALLKGTRLTADFKSSWKFYDHLR